MFLKKTPKPKGTYLAITESYYDKEKKATRQKTIMGLGYLEELRLEYSDPIAHFEKVVADMNQERETKKNSVVYVDLTCPLHSDDHFLKNIGYGILKYIYKELQLDIFWRTKTWKLTLPYNIEEIFRFLVISQIMHPDASWTDTFDMSDYFEAPQNMTSENISSAVDILANYQKDIQKWIYEHSSSLFQRDYSLMCLDHSSYSFSHPKEGDEAATHATHREYTKIHLNLLTDRSGIPIAYDTVSDQEPLVQAIPQAVRWIKRSTSAIHVLSTASEPPSEKAAVTDSIPTDGYFYGQSDSDFKEEISPLFHKIRHIETYFHKILDGYNSSPFFCWDQNRISGFFIINFTAITLIRLLQAKLDFRFSMAQIVNSLQKYNCVQIARNIYQFTYYDQILEACEKNLGLELHNKYSNQIQIRRLLRY